VAKNTEARSGTADPPGEWADVVEALNALGDRIERVKSAGGGDDAQRLRELADGLAALARRIAEPAVPGQTAAFTRIEPVEPVAASLCVHPEPIPHEFAIEDAGVPVTEELRPHVMEALRSVNEKFRQAGAWEPLESTPAAAAPVAARVPVPSAVAASVPAVEPPASPVPTGPIAPPPDRMAVVKAARERFAAERLAAEQAAAARNAASEALLEPLPGLGEEAENREPHPSEGA
jgi:hypothetical protein